MIALRALACGGVLLALAGCASRSAEAERFGTAFCGAASARDEAAATAMMTPELQAQIARLRAFDAEFRRQRPGDKPPLGDGLRLTAYPDAVAGCTVTMVTPLELMVHYQPAGAAGGGWDDRLLLVRTPQHGLRIGEIAFAGDNRVRLRRWLDEAMIG